MSQEITIKQNEPITTPSGDTITLSHTGTASQNGQVTQTAIVVVTPAGE